MLCNTLWLHWYIRWKHFYYVVLLVVGFQQLESEVGKIVKFKSFLIESLKSCWKNEAGNFLSKFENDKLFQKAAFSNTF